MRRLSDTVLFLAASLILISCSQEKKVETAASQVYQDVPYLQDFAVKYQIDIPDVELMKVAADRNGVIQVLSSHGLLRPSNGHFQYPGTLEPDGTYRPMVDKDISDLLTYQDQFVYLDDQAVFSNAWAGKLFSRHLEGEASIVCGGDDFTFLIADGKGLTLVRNDEILFSENSIPNDILDIKFASGTFYILSANAIFSLDQAQKKLSKIHDGSTLTCFDISAGNQKIYVGTVDGYYTMDISGNSITQKNARLPWTELTALMEIDGKLWFGSSKGAFMLREDGKFNYYYGQRWLPGDTVIHIAGGPDSSVLLLTEKGLGQICFKSMTLDAKAMIYEDQVRQRHIRYGINSNVTRLGNHDLSTAENSVADSDNLWTGMYLGSAVIPLPRNRF
ncbi:MAG: hypothetical protein U5K79_12940 [Cyclobacteriaceae bacterium]|nr:hypothetical protein [Cyclobacteriaceae bacterium]